MTYLRVVWQAFRLQAELARRGPQHLLMLLVTPMQTASLLALTLHSHRPDALVNAVIAPGMIGLWVAALDYAGRVVPEDQWAGRFTPMVAAPVPLTVVVVGRVAAVVLVGAVAFAESWLTAAVGFGRVLTVAEPGVFAAAVLATCLAAVGTAMLLSGVIALSRARDVLQNSLSYPFYILGGVVFPITVLPAWVRPFSRVVFLSWSAQLLRDAAHGTVRHWAVSLAVILALGAAALAGGMWLTRRVVDGARRKGTVGFA
ncbi:ABC transporter permease [Actinomadura rupiterrae]|uniref:ABC transporter permease n=1 Tax=Actinomadura rupiterrae TaxID=559627 RepID=UPI0020A25582|nr:ABC transporter permease [Actinomadura rupiterrae]MCP2340827.1 ABC-2 type transport system permease protein [Actinomadura rupiterrae]